MEDLIVRTTPLSFEEIQEMYSYVMEASFNDDGEYFPLIKQMAINQVFFNVICQGEYDGEDILDVISTIEIDDLLKSANNKDVVAQWNLFYRSIDDAIESKKKVFMNDTNLEKMAESITLFVNDLREVVSNIDLDKINKRLGSLTPQKLINAYMKSDVKRNNERDLLDEKNKQIKELQQQLNYYKVKNVFDTTTGKNVVNINDLIRNDN